MSVFVLAALALMLGVAPVLARSWLRTVHPALAAKTIAVSLVGALVATELVAVSLGAPVVLRAGGAHGLAARCARMASHAVIGAPWIGWVSVAGALMLPMAVALGSGVHFQPSTRCPKLRCSVARRPSRGIRLLLFRRPTRWHCASLRMVVRS